MRSFNRGRSGGNSFNKRNFGRDRRDSGPREMHDAICAECGRNCQVPFEPTSSKPVYCSVCFAKNGGDDPRRNFNRGGRQGNFSPRRQNDERSGSSYKNNEIELINKKLDKILELLSKTEKQPEEKVTSED